MSQSDPIDDRQSKSRRQPKSTSQKKQADPIKKQANFASRDIEALILTTAARLMPDYGYSRLTMRDLAQGAGIGLGTVYGYFQSKEEIGVRLVARGVEVIHQEMKEILQQSLDPSACLRHLLVARVMLRQQQTQGQRHPINERTPELLFALKAMHGDWRKQEEILLAQAISRWEDRLQVPPGSVDYYVPTLLWATDGLVEEALQPFPSTPIGYPVTEAKSSPTVILREFAVASKDFIASKDFSLSDSRSANYSFSTDDSSAALNFKIMRVADLLIAGIKRT